MKALVLAGGSGTRLWPLSRKNYPKQFLKLNGKDSLLRQTVDRLLNVLSKDEIIVMTNDEYRFYVKSDLKEIKHVLLIVTFGIKPDRPETGYGYIKARADQPAELLTQAEGSKQEIRGRDYLLAGKFVEKPDAATARQYLDAGDYYWNSGMFGFSIKTMMDELRNYAPAIRDMLDKSFDEMNDQFHKMPEISIDYAVMERSDRVALLPLDLYWNDIGSWDSLYDILSRDENGNAAVGDVMAIDTKNCLIYGDKRLLSTIGLEDCLAVETEDAVLIAKKGEAWKVREIVNRLKENRRKEASEHVTTYRPWGTLSRAALLIPGLLLPKFNINPSFYRRSSSER
jgi:mannose-1-phosphate guanylyltransferase/mannose-6-phosphate isomerase